MRRLVGEPETGYEIHHIIAQTPAEQHWKINAWYATRNKDFDGLSPRDYRRGKSWEEKVEVGLNALKDTGVLEP